jgi:anti-sigma regulatory factor (Ser/Thr protein kinase)
MTSNDSAPDTVRPPVVLADATAVADVADDGVTPVLDQTFDAGTLYALRAAVQAHAIRLGMSEARTDDLVIAVHELAANAVRHGAGDGRVRMWERAGALHCQVEDAGDATPLDGPDGPGGNAADNWPFVSGHGLWLARLVAEEISVASGPDGTCAKVVFVLPGPDPSGPDPSDAETR